MLVVAALLWSAGFAQEAGERVALRLAHLSPDAPLVDLLIDGRLRLTDIAFEEVSGYLLLDAGRHELRVFPHHAATPAQPDSAPETTAPSADSAGAPGSDASSDLGGTPKTETAEGASTAVAPLEPFVISVDLAAGGYYTVGMVGFFNPPAAQTAAGSLSVEVDPGTTVRITGPRSYAVGLDRSQSLTRLEPGPYTVVASREGFQTATFQVRINPGEATTLPIDLQQGGDGSSTTTPPTPAAEELGTPVWHRTQLQLYEDSFTNFPPAGATYLRVVHAAPGVNAVDIDSRREAATAAANPADPAVGASSALQANLEFPNASPYLTLVAGQQMLEVRLAGTDFVLTTLQDVNLVPGAFYTLYLIGALNDRFLTPLPTVDAVLRGPFDGE